MFVLWKASVCCKAYLLPLMLYHYKGLNHICLSPDYHCCTISTEPKSTSESLGPQKNLLEEKRWETSHLLDLCWKLKAVNSIHNLGENGCGITIHKMRLAKIHMLFFVRSFCWGQRLWPWIFAFRGPNRGRFSFREHDSGSVNKWHTSLDAPLGSGKLILTNSLCIFNGIINIAFQHFNPFT